MSALLCALVSGDEDYQELCKYLILNSKNLSVFFLVFYGKSVRSVFTVLLFTHRLKDRKYPFGASLTTNGIAQAVCCCLGFILFCFANGTQNRESFFKSILSCLHDFI
jgi:hypothetical protein